MNCLDSIQDRDHDSEREFAKVGRNLGVSNRVFQPHFIYRFLVSSTFPRYLLNPSATTKMAEPEKDLDKLREEQAKDDSDILADLDKESKEFDKASQ